MATAKDLLIQKLLFSQRKETPVAKKKAKKKAKRKVARKKGAPTKNCPKCGKKNHAAVRSCKKCGFEFTAKKKKRRRRKKKAAAAPAAVSDRVSMSSLVAAKKLADQLGGVQKAQDALRALSRLS